MFSYLEDDTGDVFGSFGHYSGPRGGVFSFLDGSAGVFDGQGGVKLAGADHDTDRDTGRKAQERDDEPKSLLSATSEQLEKMVKGTGEALDKGAAGAKTALTRTWGELTQNEELHKGVEFGVKAAGEVSKDVWERVGWDAATAWGAGVKALRLGETAGQFARSAAKGLVISGGNDYFDLPQKSRDIGTRIESQKDRIYGK